MSCWLIKSWVLCLAPRPRLSYVKDWRQVSTDQAKAFAENLAHKPAGIIVDGLGMRV